MDSLSSTQGADGYLSADPLYDDPLLLFRCVSAACCVSGPFDHLAGVFIRLIVALSGFLHPGSLIFLESTPPPEPRQSPYLSLLKSPSTVPYVLTLHTSVFTDGHRTDRRPRMHRLWCLCHRMPHRCAGLRATGRRGLFDVRSGLMHGLRQVREGVSRSRVERDSNGSSHRYCCTGAGTDNRH